MHGHPVQGIKGAKAKKHETGKFRLSSRPEKRITELSEQYIELRNRAQAAKAEAAEMALAEKKGILIPTRLATMHVAYMLTCFRQRVLAEPVTLPGRLVAGGFLEETRQHDAAEMVKADLCAMLEELADLPYRISDPDWVAKIDPDLRPKVEGDGESGSSGRVTDPSEVKREAAKARCRRRKKTETMRELRAKIRAK
jgi:hypothetical protein